MCSGKPHGDGILFGPTLSGKLYLSVYYHRQPNRSQDKCIWCIPPTQEYKIFNEIFNDKNWQDSDRHYWGVHNQGNSPLGTLDERFQSMVAIVDENGVWLVSLFDDPAQFA